MTPLPNALIHVREGGALDFGAFRLTSTGLVVTGAPTSAEWASCGHVLRRIEGAVQFWIDNWVNYGEKAYGTKYTQAHALTDLEEKTLRNYAYVAS